MSPILNNGVCFLALSEMTASHFACFSRKFKERNGIYPKIFAKEGAVFNLFKSQNIPSHPIFEREVEAVSKIVEECKEMKVVVDLDGPFATEFQKKLKERNIKTFAYYRDPEPLGMGYLNPKLTLEALKISNIVLFANENLAKTCKNPLSDWRGIGYYHLELATAILNKKKSKGAEIRNEILNEGERLILCLGEEDATYFSDALPPLLELITGLKNQYDLSRYVILIQQNRAVKIQECLINWLVKEKSDPYSPTIELSKWDVEDAISAADLILYQKSPLAPIFPAINTAVAQIGRIPDILVRTGLAPTVENEKQFLNLLISLEEPKPEPDLKRVLSILGAREDWFELLMGALE